ncbi:MAG: sigma-70 family RNA polymerase sigma factor [Tabrizicola sp.]
MSQADDPMQDTILKARTNMDRFDPATNLDDWLFTILPDTFCSGLRKTRREVQDSDGVHAGAPSVNPAHDGRLALQEFQRAFDQLSPEHGEVLILVDASGFSCEDAAALMGVAVGTVRSRASRTRNRLADLLHLEGARICSAAPTARRRRSCCARPRPDLDRAPAKALAPDLAWHQAGDDADVCADAAGRLVHRPDPGRPDAA